MVNTPGPTVGAIARHDGVGRHMKITKRFPHFQIREIKFDTIQRADIHRPMNPPLTAGDSLFHNQGRIGGDHTQVWIAAGKIAAALTPKLPGHPCQPGPCCTQAFEKRNTRKVAEACMSGTHGSFRKRTPLRKMQQQAAK